MALTLRSGKLSSSLYINHRVSSAHGQLLANVARLEVKDKNGQPCSYKLSDVLYDIRRGFLSLSPGIAAHASITHDTCLPRSAI